MKGGGLAIVLADAYKKRGKGGGEDKPKMEEEGEDEGSYGDLAQEAMDSIKDDDPEGLASALKAFMRACMKDYG